ncbi:4-coumarate--CoA ligase 3-like 2 [Homarus americanus]|uniref:4-coumarate--CoA ligase 3-like 2 n=1 Tax=Homarus americanus TaxID=6706 RepID=A0A8J5JET7_HOMAM|nr:4-coumarate--CoA ligase 3-like 2 [Homarus americanus]
MGILPYFHIYGLVPCLGLSLITGSKSVTVPTFDPKSFVHVLEKYKITYLHTVPPIINFLTQSNLVKPHHLGPTHTMTCGAAPAGPTLIEEFFKKFGDGINFQEGYGMTEASPVTHLTPKGKFVIGSTGVVVPNTVAKIVDINTGQSLGANEEGEMCVMKGYYKNEKATRETIDEDGWLHTGDLAKMDHDQNVYIVDRLKELIKVKGFQVAPAELEDLIRSHPEVEDVAVIGLPHDRLGEVPRAYVVLTPNSNLSEEAIADYVAIKVAPHKQLLGGVYFTNVIPKSATGKILRRELKASALVQ